MIWTSTVLSGKPYIPIYISHLKNAVQDPDTVRDPSYRYRLLSGVCVLPMTNTSSIRGKPKTNKLSRLRDVPDPICWFPPPWLYLLCFHSHWNTKRPSLHMATWQTSPGCAGSTPETFCAAAISVGSNISVWNICVCDMTEGTVSRVNTGCQRKVYCSFLRDRRWFTDLKLILSCNNYCTPPRVNLHHCDAMEGHGESHCNLKILTALKKKKKTKVNSTVQTLPFMTYPALPPCFSKLFLINSRECTSFSSPCYFSTLSALWALLQFINKFQSNCWISEDEISQD